MFFKKAKKLSEKVQAIEQRITEIQKDIELWERHINEKKQELSAILGTLALSPDDQEQLGLLSRGKKALGIQQENLEDLKLQLNFLLKEKEKLGTELLEARVRDIPGQAESAAETFNEILGEALEAMEVLQEVYNRLKTAETLFHNLLREYQSSCKRLGIVKGLEIKTGLGELAFVGGLFGMAFQLPDFQFFLANLMGYKSKVKGYKEFLVSNPNYQADIEKVRQHDAKAAEWRKFGTDELGWKVFSPRV